MIWFALLKSNWRLIGILAVVAAIGGYIVTLHIQRDNARKKAENIQAAFDQFQAKVRVEGEAAKLRVAETIANSERAKNETITLLQSDLVALDDDLERLRLSRARSGGSFLPALPAGAAAANRPADCGWAILDGALQDFDREVESYVVEGDRGIALRDSWHLWHDRQLGAHD